jgi:predicted HAD superfamily phosphohydrolase YqeG
MAITYTTTTDIDHFAVAREILNGYLNSKFQLHIDDLCDGTYLYGLFVELEETLASFDEYKTEADLKRAIRDRKSEIRHHVRSIMDEITLEDLFEE